MEARNQKARAMAQDFLLNETQYRLGFLEAEQSNPKTRSLGQTFLADPAKGVEMILSVDRDLVDVYAGILRGEAFARFCKLVADTLGRGNRIFLSGCGATGRLCIRLEASWERAVVEKHLSHLSGRVLSVMTGGDYAIIRSLESFDDYSALGGEQVRRLGIRKGDLLIGVTATAETTSILGTAMETLRCGGNVMMVVCTDPVSVTPRLERARLVFSHPNTDYIYIPCGGMAVTGSTRMQSSTVEQAVIAAALESVLVTYTQEQVRPEDFIQGMAALVDALGKPETVQKMADYLLLEKQLYDRGGYVTYFAHEYQLDIITDTTERSPTFSTPAFRPKGMEDQPMSWAFVKNPMLTTPAAWENCFCRNMRCLSWEREVSEKLGLRPDEIDKIPPIDNDALCGFQIGMEPMPERELEESLAVWVGMEAEVPAAFRDAAKGYARQEVLVFPQVLESLVPSALHIWRHLAVKLIMNIISTGTMACMGRVQGNYMVYLYISNKKLIDRSIRIISDLCSISYEKACLALFDTVLWMEETGQTGYPAQKTMERLRQQL
jgi:N-acetylmuramic acid 6-phosphate etherase